MKENDRVRVLEASLDRTIQWISAAESRAPLILALSTAMLGALAASLPASWADWSFAMKGFGIPAATLGFLCLIFLAGASFPRTRGPDGSLLYFGGVSSMKLEEFIGKTQAMDDASFLLDLQRQCHRNAEIAASKFRWIQRAKIALYASVLPWVVTIAILRM